MSRHARAVRKQVSRRPAAWADAHGAEGYVEVARTDFLLDGKSQTDSRITLLTGLSRRDVRQIRTETHADEPLAASLETRVARAWTAKPFIDGNGKRLALPRLSSVGGPRSFEALVRHVSSDIRASVLLDSWVKQGVVSISADDLVQFNNTVYFHRDAKVEDTSIHTAHVTADFVSGMTDLMSNCEPRPIRMHLVNCDHMTKQSVDRIFEHACQRMDTVASQINQLGEDAAAVERGHADARHRLTFCIYVYRTDMDVDPPVMWAEPGLMAPAPVRKRSRSHLQRSG
jgi:hypothetical protein